MTDLDRYKEKQLRESFNRFYNCDLLFTIVYACEEEK